MSIETKIAQQLIADALAAGGRVSIVIHAPTGRAQFDLQPGRGVDLITDYDGPEEMTTPMIEAAQNVVDPLAH